MPSAALIRHLPPAGLLLLLLRWGSPCLILFPRLRFPPPRPPPLPPPPPHPPAGGRFLAQPPRDRWLPPPVGSAAPRSAPQPRCAWGRGAKAAVAGGVRRRRGVRRPPPAGGGSARGRGPARASPVVVATGGGAPRQRGAPCPVLALPAASPVCLPPDWKGSWLFLKRYSLDGYGLGEGVFLWVFVWWLGFAFLFFFSLKSVALLLGSCIFSAGCEKYTSSFQAGRW